MPVTAEAVAPALTGALAYAPVPRCVQDALEHLEVAHIATAASPCARAAAADAGQPVARTEVGGGEPYAHGTLHCTTPSKLTLPLPDGALAS